MPPTNYTSDGKNKYVYGEWQGRSQQVLQDYQTISKAFLYHIKRRLSGKDGPLFVNAAISEPFLLLGDLYRIIASGWDAEIENEHMQLAWLEWFYLYSRILCSEEDKKFGDPSTSRIEEDFMYLHRHRIKIGAYHQLIEETLKQVQDRGAAKWNHSDSKLTESNASYLENEDRTRRLESRIMQDIEFVRAYMDEKTSRQSYLFSQRIFLLTLFAAITLPFTLMASIFSLPGKYTAFVSNHYWAYLVSALLLTMISVLSVAYVYCKQRREKKREKKLVAEFDEPLLCH